MCPPKLLCICDNESVFDLNTRPKRLKSLNVQINLAASDITAARKRYLRVFILSKKRPKKIIGCPDLLDIIILDHKP